jgi:hypothetical protein
MPKTPTSHHEKSNTLNSKCKKHHKAGKNKDEAWTGPFGNVGTAVQESWDWMDAVSPDNEHTVLGLEYTHPLFACHVGK